MLPSPPELGRRGDVILSPPELGRRGGDDVCRTNIHSCKFFWTRGTPAPPPYVNMSCIIHTSMRLRSTMVPSIISHMWWPSNHYYPPSNQHPSPSILPLSTAYLPLHTPPPHQLSHHAQPSIHYPYLEAMDSIWDG